NIGLVIGNMNAMYDDLSSGKSQRIAAGSAQVDLNNLIYLKFNHNNIFANPKLRQAVAVLLNKEELMNAGFEGYGQATDVPFNPQWFGAEGLKGPELSYQEAQEYLTRALGKYNIDILVNSDNMFKLKCAETVASELAIAGISASVQAVPRELMDEGVELGNYDLYVAEFKMSNDMNIGPLLHEEDDLDTQVAFFTFLSGNTSGEDFMAVFNENMPFIPVCIRYGLVSYSKDVQGGVAPLPNNPYANLMEWYL
ncbi:MAG: ABC transporter substrate-binding protein, partial [Clostridia bacterium]|nr:ABC transporter substrate-binding protein [Clostridia bacterium]